MKKSVLHPSHPERICWGCDRYCAAHDLICGNGTIRTPHPVELFGKDWLEWAEDHDRRCAGPDESNDAPVE
jgi:hypothetical protein